MKNIIGSKIIKYGTKFLIIGTVKEAVPTGSKTKWESDIGWAYCWVQFMDPMNYFAILVPDGTTKWITCSPYFAGGFTASIHVIDNPDYPQEMDKNGILLKDYYAPGVTFRIYHTCTIKGKAGTFHSDTSDWIKMNEIDWKCAEHRWRIETHDGSYRQDQDKYSIVAEGKCKDHNYTDHNEVIKRTESHWLWSDSEYVWGYNYFRYSTYSVTNFNRAISLITTDRCKTLTTSNIAYSGTYDRSIIHAELEFRLTWVPRTETAYDSISSFFQYLKIPVIESELERPVVKLG